MSIFTRMDATAREIVTLAGNIAAERERERTGEKFPTNVKVGVSDMREAYRLIVRAAGWGGSYNAALARRFGRLPDDGPITAEDIRKALR